MTTDILLHSPVSTRKETREMQLIWVVVKLMALFWIPIIIRPLIFRVPQKGTIILTTNHLASPQKLSPSCIPARAVATAPCSTQGILRVLHDPEYVIPLDSWSYNIMRSCRISSINNSLIKAYTQGNQKHLHQLAIIIPDVSEPRTLD